MCTVTDDDIGVDEVKFMEYLKLTDEVDSSCLKCKCQETSIRLRGKDNYCTSCFLSAVDHKFRATLGKSRLLRHQDNVLLIFDGGEKSSTMLQIVHNGMDGEYHKKFVFNPHLLFVDKRALLKENIDLGEFYKGVKKYGFKTYVTSISKALKEDDRLYELLDDDFKYEEYFNSFDDKSLLDCFANMTSLTSKQDLLNTLNRKLILRIAKSLNCKFIFVPDISPTIASKTLAGFALGRGSHISMEVGFCDTRDPDVSILRPMRDFSTEEVQKYCAVNQLQSFHQTEFGETNNLYSSIQNLTDRFIHDLQDNFPATVYTVIRTADKLVTQKKLDGVEICSLCGSPRDNLQRNGNLSALNAVQYSKIASTQSGEMLARDSFDKATGNISVLSEFYCHACSLTFKDVKNKDLFLS